jgi:hypothetical protein
MQVKKGRKREIGGLTGSRRSGTYTAMPETTGAGRVFYTGKETAEKLQLDPKTLRKYVREGVCPVMPEPGIKPPRWRAAKVDAYVDAADV